VSDQSTQFTTFTIERYFAHAPAQVFAAWSSAAAKSKWFAGGDDWQQELRSLDFHVGGAEQLRGVWKNGVVTFYDSRFHDIVKDQRIVYAYDMYMDQRKISVSLSTVEFISAKEGCLMKYTEQCVFLDGYVDNGSRERGTQGLIDQLENSLSGSNHKTRD